MNHTLKYEIGITLIPLVGDITAKKLISYCGSAEAVFKETKKKLRRIPGIGETTINAIKGKTILNRADEEITFIEKYHINPVYYLSPDYPQRLRNCIDSPVMLYFKGNSDLNHSRVLSIVGTRNPSLYGKNICREIIEQLKEYNVMVVSGLAYGIDSIAHRTSVNSDITNIAVLGHGLDRIYPGENKKLAVRIMQNGGLLTDFISGTKPDYINFPKRNRIVAGMSDAVLVVESAKKGGALITADIANSYNKDVFAVPGKLHEKYSEGCNYLISTNRAALFQSVEEFVMMMGWEQTKSRKSVQKKLFVDLNSEEKLILNLIEQKAGIGIDKISIESQINMTKLSSILLKLEMEGLIICLPGKYYKIA